MDKNRIKFERDSYALKIRELELFIKAAKDAINLAHTDCEIGKIYSYPTYYSRIDVVGNLKRLINTKYVKYRIDNVTYNRAELDKLIRSSKDELKEMQKLYSKYDSLLTEAVNEEKMENVDKIDKLKDEIQLKSIELQKLKDDLKRLESSL